MLPFQPGTFGLFYACVIWCSFSNFNGDRANVVSLLIGTTSPWNFQSLLALSFDLWYFKSIMLNLSSTHCLSCAQLGTILIFKKINFTDFSLGISFFHKHISLLSLPALFARLTKSPSCICNFTVSKGLLPKFHLFKFSKLELWPLAPVSGKVSFFYCHFYCNHGCQFDKQLQITKPQTQNSYLFQIQFFRSKCFSNFVFF